MGAGQSTDVKLRGATAADVASPRHISARAADLDKYGGADRPAIKRGDSFNKAMDWLGESAVKQADDLQTALVTDMTPLQDVSPFSTDGSSFQGGSLKGLIWPQRNSKNGTSNTNKATQKPAKTVPNFMSATRTSAAGQIQGIQKRMSLQKGPAEPAKGLHGVHVRVELNKALLDKRDNKTAKTGKAAQQTKPAEGRTDRRGARTAKSDYGTKKTAIVPAENWRQRVQEAKKTAYLTLKVHLRLQGLRGNSLPEAMRVNTNGWVRGSLNTDFEKFVENQKRFFRVSSSFDLRRTSGGFQRSASYARVVDLGTTDGEFKNSSMDLELVNDAISSGEDEDPEPIEITQPELKPRQMMDMMARKANAKWVERRKWTSPVTYDIHNYTLSVERAHYNHKAKVALRKGRIAFHFVASGEELVTPDGRRLSCITSDPWDLLQSSCPMKIPCGMRVDGLPPAARQIAQLVDSVRRLVGQEGVDNLQIVLTISEDEEDMVANLLRGHKFYGLEPEQISIMIQSYMHGWKYDKKKEDLAENEESELRLPGTGHAMLQFGVANCAKVLDGHALATRSATMLDHFKVKGVAWLMSVKMIDLHWCSEQGGTDLDFFGLALKLQESQGANMMVEAAPCGSLLEARQNNSIIMGLAGSENRGAASCDVASSDCMTMKLHEQLNSIAESGGKLYTSQRRYLYFLPEMERQIMEQATFRGDVVVVGGHVYVDFDASDLTSGPHARCAAIVQRPGKPKAPPATSLVPKSWIEGLGAPLNKQDNQDDFCQLVLQSQSRIAPITISRKPFQHEKSLRIVLFVSDNPASRKALRMAKILMQNDANHLRIAHVVASQPAIESAEELLGFYRDLLGVVPSNNLATDVVMRRSNTTVNALSEYVVREATDLVIMGSEKLASAHPMASVTLAALKTIKVPVLVVKPDSCGPIMREEIDHKKRSDRRPIRCAVPVDNSTRGVLKYVTEVLSPMTDKLLLVRFAPLNRPGQMEEANMDKRMIGHFQDVASGHHFKSQSITADGNLNATTYSRVAVENNCDVMAIRRARGKIAPDLEELLKRAKVSLLIHQDEDGGNPLK